jgi:endonuclease III
MSGSSRRPPPRSSGSGAAASRRQVRAQEAVRRLARATPQARIALHFQSDVELLISVILSAQCTDARVNQVTPALFAAFPDAGGYAQVRPEELWPYIRSCGLFRTKSRTIVEAMRAILNRHQGRVPRTRQELEALPGVGRKTAGVVLLHLGAGHAFPVDTHVGRVARRLGLTRQRDPSRVEQDLMSLLPPRRWGRAHQLFVWHGRRVCRARRPECQRCTLGSVCPKVGVER